MPEYDKDNCAEESSYPSLKKSERLGSSFRVGWVELTAAEQKRRSNDKEHADDRYAAADALRWRVRLADEASSQDADCAERRAAGQPGFPALHRKVNTTYR